jgi:hypothetical protein
LLPCSQPADDVPSAASAALRLAARFWFFFDALPPPAAGNGQQQQQQQFGKASSRAGAYIRPGVLKRRFLHSKTHT